MTKLTWVLVLGWVALATAQLPGLPAVPGAGSLTRVLPLADIQKHITSQKGQLGSLINIPNADTTSLASLFPAVGGAGAAKIAECYNSSMGAGNQAFDMFQNNIFDVVNAYYRAFPENFDINRFPEKARNLFQGMTEIAQYTVSCLNAPKGFQLGLTQLSDFSVGEFLRLMGAKPLDSAAINKYKNRPKNLQEPGEETTTPKRKNNALGGLSGGLFRRKREAVEADPNCFPKDKSAVPKEYDYKNQGLVTEARYQGQCGSCWTFASIASLESAYRIKGKAADVNFDLSEQQLLTCAKEDGKGNGCEGGTPVDAFNFILSNFGITDEKTIGYDYEKKDKKCETKKKKRHAKIKDYCLRGTYVTVNGKPEVLTDTDIQQAIREFGSVYATVYGEDTNLKHYKSGIFDDPECKKETNHAIVIVGWDDKSWIVKNSWGKKWGEDGFFRLARGKNMCGINTYITFPIV